MPAPGDQYRDTPASANPFLDKQAHLSEYTAQQIATLQSRLDKQLGPEYISTRPGAGGGKVHYLAAEKVISLANEVFGFNGWSSQIQNVQIDFVDENPTNGKINLGLSTIVRVTLRDGTFHEDIGYGHCENTKGKAAAFEKAKKEAATDAMKRALRTFGNVLGNCLYDKDYLQKVTKVKVAPSKWDAGNLHRHPDYAPIKREIGTEVATTAGNASAVQRNPSVQSVQSVASFGSGEFEDDFGGGMFDETDFTHSDEVRLDDTTSIDRQQSPAPRPTNGAPQQNGQRQTVPRVQSMPQMRPPDIQQPPHVQSVQAPQRPANVQRPPMNAGQLANRMLPPQLPGSHQRPQQMPNNMPPQQIQQQNRQQNLEGSRSTPSSGTATDSSNDQIKQRPNLSNSHQQQAQSAREDHDFSFGREPPPGAPQGFISGSKAELLQNAATVQSPSGNMAFNPHADSPSIRRTQGVNPGKSAPVSRSSIAGGQNVAAQLVSAAPQQTSGANGVNGGGQRANFVDPSADMNRRIGMPQAGAFGNRSSYRPPTLKRPAMADVTNIQQTDGAADPKKAKIQALAPAAGENIQDGVPLET